WPREPPVFREIFRPFTVPVRNLRRAPSRVIECDGTQDSYPVRIVHEDRSYALQRMHGVYRLTDDGTEPLRPGVLAELGPNYEAASADAAPGPSYALVVRLPQAFLEPERLVVDGAWYQPEFAEHAVGPIRIMLADRSLPGLQWQSVGPVRS